MNPLRVGVIGTGHLGALHTKMYAQIPTAHLIGVYDIDSARSEKSAAEFGTKAFTQMDDLLENVEAVSIATVTQSHYDVAMQVIKRGVHLLIEKPITATIEQARKLTRVGGDERIKAPGRTYRTVQFGDSCIGTV